MGECGCSAFTAHKKFPGPDDSIYVARVYPGCADCGRIAGVDIYRLDKEHDEFVDHTLEMCAETPALEFHKEIRGQSIASIPVLDAAILVREMVAHGADEIDAAEFVESAFTWSVSKTFEHYEKRDRGTRVKAAEKASKKRTRIDPNTRSDGGGDAR